MINQKGYINHNPRWFCNNYDNFRFIESPNQLLEKCFTRQCPFLVDFHKLTKPEQAMYLKLLTAKNTGEWIHQEKTRCKPHPYAQSKSTHPISSGTESAIVECPICFTKHYSVLPNQHIVFCQCGYLITNQLALEV